MSKSNRLFIESLLTDYYDITLDTDKMTADDIATLPDDKLQKLFLDFINEF